MNNEFTFIVKIQGNWLTGAKQQPVSISQVQKELRETVKDRFQILAEDVTVVRCKGNK